MQNDMQAISCYAFIAMNGNARPVLYTNLRLKRFTASKKPFRLSSFGRILAFAGVASRLSGGPLTLRSLIYHPKYIGIQMRISPKPRLSQA